MSHNSYLTIVIIIYFVTDLQLRKQYKYDYVIIDQSMCGMQRDYDTESPDFKAMIKTFLNNNHKLLSINYIRVIHLLFLF